MKPMAAEVYKFRGYTLDVSVRTLLDPEGNSIKLFPKAFDTLVCLVRRHGEVISREEFLESIWPDTIVEENNLTQCISALRKSFEEAPGEQRFIATIPGKGYLFVAEVDCGYQEIESEGKADRSSKADLPAGSLVGKKVAAGLVLTVTVASIVVVFMILAGQATEGGSEVRSVAVLPFGSLSSGPPNEAIQLGMTESLISELQRSGGIRVSPFTAIKKFGAADRDPVTAGKELTVDAVVDGSIEAAGGRVKVSISLYRVSSGEQFWSETFDDKFNNLFHLQDRISEETAKALGLKQRERRSSVRSTDSIEAYELYLRGKVLISKLVKPDVEKGISYFEKAILEDPGYAMPYVGIADAQRALLLSNDAKATEVIPRAKVAALRAIELDPNLAEARSSLGRIAFFFDWDWGEAESQFQKALEIDGNNTDAMLSYAHLLSNTGRGKEALRFAEMAHRAEPTNVLFMALEAQFLNFDGQGEEAIRKLRAVVDLDGNFWLGHFLLSSALADSGRYEEAIKEADIAKRLAPFQTISDAFKAYSLAEMGRKSEARKLLDDLLAREREIYVPPTNIAMVYAALGENEKAFEYLERGFDERDSRIAFLKVERKWKPIREEPEFRAMLKRVRLD